MISPRLSKLHSDVSSQHCSFKDTDTNVEHRSCFWLVLQAGISFMVYAIFYHIRGSKMCYIVLGCSTITLRVHVAK